MTDPEQLNQAILILAAAPPGVAVGGFDAARRFTLPLRRATSLGKGAANAIRVRHPGLPGRRTCAVGHDDAGRWWLRHTGDHGPAPLLNGAPLPQSGPVPQAPLRDGDTFELVADNGRPTGVRFIFRLGPPPAR
jgi:hypothetical protein